MSGTLVHARYVQALETLRARYNRREFVHPDPLEFLYGYEDARDREVAGLIASSLAYGRVGSILRSVARVLERMDRPARFLEEASEDVLFTAFRDFRHRVTSGETLSLLLLGAKRVISQYGSLGACFKAALKEEHDTVFPALSSFVGELARAAGSCPTHLLPVPAKGGACKRLNLFLRWMVRRDEVDPGGWDGVPPSKLVIPLDTHMHAMGRMLGFTKRRQADRRTALEITAAFRSIAPEDPVRYDFALTRLGIRGDGDLEGFMKDVRAEREA
jgi:uncharacterized protein (TIGR02757 family)